MTISDETNPPHGVWYLLFQSPENVRVRLLDIFFSRIQYHRLVCKHMRLTGLCRTDSFTSNTLDSLSRADIRGP